jgi:hypothetical protein
MDEQEKVWKIPPRLKCALSLRPNERVMDAYVERKPYAVAIIHAWNPGIMLGKVTVVVSPAEFDRLKANAICFLGV